MPLKNFKLYKKKTLNKGSLRLKCKFKIRGQQCNYCPCTTMKLQESLYINVKKFQLHVHMQLICQDYSSSCPGNKY